ncbi:Putative uncharacterized protein [Moritella viscosa]|uniref:imm11 family protein n=1 Tax=Moritella viscosa TaxID=80854 RepID=UPI00091472ED|nr:DUF1629 domain-containing protein [Moritella viscosa]SGZ03143.1 Putative uncharacterized protein [Moritella viscosa]
MKIAKINEALYASNAMFMSDDARAYLYEDIDYIPVSIAAPIIWTDDNVLARHVFDITNAGDLSVTAKVAEIFMSFDPYGITVLPNRLDCADGMSEQVRYVIAINNEIDVLDEDKSHIERKVRHYDPEEHGYDLPLEERGSYVTERIDELYLSEEKMKKVPKCKRHIFRVKGVNVFFFSNEIYDVVYPLTLNETIYGIDGGRFDLSNRIPKL